MVVDAPLLEIVEPTHLEPKDQATCFAWDATHYNPYVDAFPPQRNRMLLRGLEIMKQYPGGEALYEKAIRENLVKVRTEEINKGFVVIRNLVSGHRYSDTPQIKIELTSFIKERAKWWNDRAREILDSSGVWFDVGNLMLEPRFVGNSLRYEKRPDLDLYSEFGVTPETFVLFPHLKHSPGLYNPPYDKLLFENHAGKKALLGFYKEAAGLVKKNLTPEIVYASLGDHKISLDKLVIPGTWYLDPSLPHFDPALFDKVLVIGSAKEIDPIQVRFALSTSKKRQRLFDEGKYDPKLTAGFTTLKKMKEVLSKI